MAFGTGSSIGQLALYVQGGNEQVQCIFQQSDSLYSTSNNACLLPLRHCLSTNALTPVVLETNTCLLNPSADGLCRGPLNPPPPSIMHYFLQQWQLMHCFLRLPHPMILHGSIATLPPYAVPHLSWHQQSMHRLICPPPPRSQDAAGV